MKKRNIVYSSLIIALGLFAFIYAGRYANTVNLGSGSTGGELFPRMMSAGLIVTGLVILITTLTSKKPESETTPIKWVDLAINVCVLLLFVLLLEPLGFILDSIWVTAFVMYRFGCRNYKALVIWSIVMPTVIFCIFYYVLYVSLPLGVLSSILPKY